MQIWPGKFSCCFHFWLWHKHCSKNCMCDSRPGFKCWVHLSMQPLARKRLEAVNLTCRKGCRKGKDVVTPSVAQRNCQVSQCSFGVPSAVKRSLYVNSASDAQIRFCSMCQDFLQCRIFSNAENLWEARLTLGLHIAVASRLKCSCNMAETTLNWILHKYLINEVT